MARPREFDKDAVVNRAMLLFWKQGYEATSIRDLIETMGISSSSMYEAFGDKRGVFLAALERFCAQERAQLAEQAHAAASPEQFIRYIFSTIDLAVHAQHSTQGSLALNAMVEFGTRDAGVTQLLLQHYLAIAQIIADVIQHGQEQGMVSSMQPPLILAYTILSTLHGVATVKGVHPDFSHVEAITQIVTGLLHSA